MYLNSDMLSPQVCNRSSERVRERVMIKVLCTTKLNNRSCHDRESAGVSPDSTNGTQAGSNTRELKRRITPSENVSLIYNRYHYLNVFGIFNHQFPTHLYSPSYFQDFAALWCNGRLRSWNVSIVV